MPDLDSIERIEQLEDEVKTLKAQIPAIPEMFVKYLMEDVGICQSRAYPLARGIKSLHDAIGALDNQQYNLLKKEGIHGLFLTYAILENRIQIDLDHLEED